MGMQILSTEPLPQIERYGAQVLLGELNSYCVELLYVPWHLANYVDTYSVEDLSILASLYR